MRSALKVLIRRGLLYNVQGSGTYVAERSEATAIPRVDTFADDMRRRGFEGSTRMIATRWVDATEEISTRLSVPVGESVLFVRRLRLANHEVIGFERSYFVKEAASSILDSMMAGLSGSSSSLDQLADTPNAIKHARVRTSAALFTDADTEAFNQQVPRGRGRLQGVRHRLHQRGTPVEYAETLYLSDHYFLRAASSVSPLRQEAARGAKGGAPVDLLYRGTALSLRVFVTGLCERRGDPRGLTLRGLHHVHSAARRGSSGPRHRGSGTPTRPSRRPRADVTEELLLPVSGSSARETPTSSRIAPSLTW